MLVNVAIVLATLRQVMEGAGNGKRIIVGMLLAKIATKKKSQNEKKNVQPNKSKGASSSLFF